MEDNTFLKTQSCHFYQGKQGENVVWLAESVSLFTTEPNHLELLRLFQHHHTAAEAQQALALSMQPVQFEHALAELIETGAIAPIRSEQSPEESFNPIIDAFRVVMTEACNFRCPGCFATTVLREQKSKLRTMSLETTQQVFSSILPYASQNEVLVHFFGGEPMLAFPQIRHATAILSRAHKAGEILKPTLAMTTNGSLIDQESIDFFLENEIQVGVSIEGTPELHNKIRIHADGHKTFEMVAANYSRMRDAGVDVHVLFTPYPAEQDDLPNTLRYLSKAFPSNRITINTAFQKDTLAWDVIDGYAAKLIECERFSRERNLEIDSALTPLISAIGFGQPRLSPQATGTNRVMVTVDPEGIVFRSSQKWTPDLRIGTLEEARTTQITTRHAKECFNCESRYLCGGPNEECQNATGKLLDLAKCQFHKKALELIVQNIDLFSSQEPNS